MDIQSIQAAALEVAIERNEKLILRQIVQHLASLDGVQLARVWLMGPGDQCKQCHLFELGKCRDKGLCLHLADSEGGGAECDFAQGQVRHPLNYGSVGRVGYSGQSLLLSEFDGLITDATLPASWVTEHQIKSFAGQPLIFRGQPFGVLAIFSLEKITNASAMFLRSFTDSVAAAIANARAFDEIDRLRQKLELENEYLRAEVIASHQSGDVIGQSPAIRKTMEQIDLVAPTDTTILVQGESGTGKELIARAIHETSSRKDQPLIRVNCASIPHELFESEFFGHVKGAFTGAIRDRNGRFQLADGGTLLLDEIGEIPLALQSKLLRVLQEGEFERVGEDITRKVDVRIIAATNRDLSDEVANRRFREDLFFRLSVFPIKVAALRERTGDIQLLAEHFLQLSCRKLGIRSRPLTGVQISKLNKYSWPGNIRELQNVIERAVITSRNGRLRFDLPADEKPTAGEGEYISASTPGGEVMTYEQLRDIERGNIIAALERTAGKISGPAGAAELLGLRPTTLASKIRAMSIRR